MSNVFYHSDCAKTSNEKFITTAMLTTDRVCAPPYSHLIISQSPGIYILEPS